MRRTTKTNKKFPKVQFIITSHSPLFILGMKDIFKEDGFKIYEMPTGENIGPEEFSNLKDHMNIIRGLNYFQKIYKIY